jgi:hypothetical protein
LAAFDLSSHARLLAFSGGLGIVFDMSKQIICPNPNCGYRGLATQTPRGNVAVGCLLSLFFLLPGIIYFIFMQGYRYTCPKCGMQISADN